MALAEELSDMALPARSTLRDGRDVSAFQAATSGSQSFCAAALQGAHIPSNRPHLTVVSQNGLDNGVKAFASDNGVMTAQLLASAVQARHCLFGSFTEAL